MKNLSTSSIGEIAGLNFNVLPVFLKYGIDFYCKGKNTLSEACALAACDLNEVQKELDEVLHASLEESRNFNALPIDELIAHIVEKHHFYVNKSVPEITALFQQVPASEQTTDLSKIKELFRLLANDMRQHMQKEELGLFPYIKKLQSMDESEPRKSSVQSMISVVEFEHDTSGIVLKKLVALRERITSDNQLSENLKLLFAKLQEFETDLIMHIHIENNILHKKAIELEQSMAN
jgi:Regulator of cell morphogenesis and NO signaling